MNFATQMDQVSADQYKEKCYMSTNKVYAGPSMHSVKSLCPWGLQLQDSTILESDTRVSVSMDTLPVLAGKRGYFVDLSVSKVI